MNLFGLFLVSAQLIPLSSSKIGKTTENRLPRAAQNAIYFLPPILLIYLWHKILSEEDNEQRR